MSETSRLAAAHAAADCAVFAGEHAALADAERGLDALEADLALARGRISNARFQSDQVERPDELAHFERAATLRERLGDVRGTGEALFWVGCHHQAVRGDHATATPVLERALDHARRAEDVRTQAYALRHLGVAEHRAGRLDQARELLEESTALRRRLGLDAGVAANLVGLIHIAVDQGRLEDAASLADEAAALAETSGAPPIAAQVAEARARL